MLEPSNEEFRRMQLENDFHWAHDIYPEIGTLCTLNGSESDGCNMVVYLMNDYGKKIKIAVLCHYPNEGIELAEDTLGEVTGDNSWCMTEYEGV